MVNQAHTKGTQYAGRGPHNGEGGRHRCGTIAKMYPTKPVTRRSAQGSARQEGGAERPLTALIITGGKVSRSACPPRMSRKSNARL